jgi:hypothetical protein
MARSPSENEAAAIAAAVGRFQADTAGAPGGEAEAAIGPWQRAALLEGVSAKGTAEDIEGGAGWLS